MDIKEFCKKHNLSEDQFYGKEKISGNLDLGSVTTLPDGFNPTVGGDLYLGSVTTLPDGFNDLQSWKDARVKKPKGRIDTPKNKLLFWQDGKYVKADGMFTEVVNKKGNVYKVKKIHSLKEFYLVTDGKTHAHGETLEKAKEDFRFKIISEKLKNDPIKEDTVITIPYYRAVTGACEMGVKSWIDSVFNEKEKSKVLSDGIKAKDLLPILREKESYVFEKFNSLISF